MGGRLAAVQPPRGLEDLADGEVGENSHGEDDPEHELSSKDTGALAASSGAGAESLLDVIGIDNLLERGEAIHDPTMLVRR